MDNLEVRFFKLKYDLLKNALLLTSLIALFFIFFHIFFCFKFSLIILNTILFAISGFSYFWMNRHISVSLKQYYFVVLINFAFILFLILFLIKIFPENYYLPIWLFGTIIVFTFCSNIKMGIFILLLTMVLTGFLIYNRLDLYAFITLNAQFIAYFVFGLLLINVIKDLKYKTFIYEDEIYKKSITDELTGIYNRRFFIENVEFLLKKAKRNKKYVLLCIIDFDFFKKINDVYGHDIGDEVLKQISHAIKKSLRESDIFARLGGEEFGIFIENYNPKINLCEKIRKIVETTPVKTYLKEDIYITISAGGVVTDKIYDFDKLYKIADEALYEAKKTRNQTVLKFI